MNRRIDPLGKALIKFYETGEEQKIKVYSKDVEPEEYRASYFFRTYSEMPEQEKRALKLCKGKVLDVGAGAGCHSLYLEEKGFDVTSIDTSPGCIEVMHAQGVENAQLRDIMDVKGKFDTILLLMNGIGLAGKLHNVSNFLQHLKGLLNPGGQILADSSNIFHLYEELDGNELLELGKDYLGEIQFQFGYGKERSTWFSWLYLDDKTFREMAILNDFDFELLFKSLDNAYLARLGV